MTYFLNCGTLQQCGHPVIWCFSLQLSTRVEEYSVLKSNIWYKGMHFLTQKYLIEYFIQNECFSHIINKLTSQNYMESILTSNF